MATFRTKRAYAPVEPDDGARVLVDRLWPRGLSKERAHLTDWVKGAAPSPGLRTWYGHLPERHEEFTRRYREELRSGPALDAARELVRLAREQGSITLVYAARDDRCNHAAVLAEVLGEMASTTVTGPDVPGQHQQINTT